jgi:hypothetical protein
VSKLAIVLLIVALIVLFRPMGVWGEVKRSWEQRNRILRVLIVVIGIYLIYGLYSMYRRGMLPFW